MKKDTELWLEYAEDNLKSAVVLLKSELFNPSLQSAQQAVEKYIKALLIERAAGLLKTHSIRELTGIIELVGISISINDDEIDLLDSIYLPTKYPAFSVLPYFMPNEAICKQCVGIAERVKADVLKSLRQ